MTSRLGDHVWIYTDSSPAAQFAPGSGRPSGRTSRGNGPAARLTATLNRVCEARPGPRLEGPKAQLPIGLSRADGMERINL
jgi:hypothetical protein